jgi:hypothetical protein
MHQKSMRRRVRFTNKRGGGVRAVSGVRAECTTVGEAVSELSQYSESASIGGVRLKWHLRQQGNNAKTRK